MRIFAVLWPNWVPLLRDACSRAGIEAEVHSTRRMAADWPALSAGMRSADVILLYRTNDGFWPEFERLIPVDRTVVVAGSDPASWRIATVPMPDCARVHSFLQAGGRENIDRLLAFLSGDDSVMPRPEPWEGIFHPSLGRVFDDTDGYLGAYHAWLGWAPDRHVGLLMSRTNWITGNLAVETAVIGALEQRGIGVIPVFLYAMRDQTLGNQGGIEVVDRFLTREGRSRVAGLVKMTGFPLGAAAGPTTDPDPVSGPALLRRLGVPLFNPAVVSGQTEEEWRANPAGLGMQAAWNIAFPEFEGAILPMAVGALGSDEDGHTLPIASRVERFADRLAAWLSLAVKPPASRKVAFILNNNPCVGAEASVGGGAHLDTLESVVRVMRRLQGQGYAIDPPDDGKALIDRILERKALSEFRWTTVEDIVSHGGVLARVPEHRYRDWFDAFPSGVRSDMVAAWGDPPGRPLDGVPAAMVHDGDILVTGLAFGNAVVCVQPKRGCAGARCDGTVCRILHDPKVPPPHQYLATYLWLARDFGADLLVHVGTHGNLEFLPGKGTGLSDACYPDLALDRMAHLYIYNCDNPAEGTAAKRRGHATLVDHMQTIVVPGELYGDLDALDRMLDDYHALAATEPGKAHTVGHLIVDKARGLQILDHEPGHDGVAAAVAEIHNRVTLLKGTRIPKGMHIFGDIPEGERLAEFVHGIARWDNGPDSLRGRIRTALGAGHLPWDSDEGMRADALARDAVKALIERGEGLAGTLAPLSVDAGALAGIEAALLELAERIRASDELASFAAAADGAYVPPGPAGLISRGHADVLPTGRNFYSIDPNKVPTPAGAEIGRLLAEALLERHHREEGRYPENVAIYWQCNDIMWGGGEGLAQMLHLLGVCPTWQGNGRMGPLRVIPLSELKRPRIDVTVRASGLTRDNFPQVIDLLDEAILMVAALDEPADRNFVRRHSLEKIAAEGADPADPEAWRRANYRIFSAMPGTYGAGVNLAIYASAWETDADLAEVFLAWNSFAYGKGVAGVAARPSLTGSLKSVDASFGKTMTDSYDLFGCPCQFATHGGLIKAAEAVSGHAIRNYFGDTREQGEARVGTLRDEIRRVARGKLLNPVWIESMKEHGYKGAGDMMKRVGYVYGWQATSGEVDGAIFDDIARTFVMDGGNRAFFQDNNPYALEEMTRRLIEAQGRGLWSPAPDVAAALKSQYIEIEGWIEERMADTEGDFQGGAIDVQRLADSPGWQKGLGRKTP
ncbi:MAG: cobaltochelatase subunit CobN [Telmatospirillum sp.]|nr:cobaltochelatase subunit CobN [Telmatospirillum sp.]